MMVSLGSLGESHPQNSKETIRFRNPGALMFKYSISLRVLGSQVTGGLENFRLLCFVFLAMCEEAEFVSKLPSNTIGG